MASYDLWATALWRSFLPSIACGAPFYLAADRQLIQKLYAARIGRHDSTDAGLIDFHQSCCMLLDSTGTRASVRRVAFESVPGEAYSRVICLAVQQVLVVENMLNDALYSERSYFPRYREVLGVSGAHANPLSSSAFIEIWDIFARELCAVPGAGVTTITFAAGKGPDRSRSLPLSQALFTAHDLTIIRLESCGLDHGAKDPALLTALLRVRGELGGRARKLLSAAAVDEVIAGRLCGQVRSFLSGNMFSVIRDHSAGAATSETVIAYLDRANAFDLDSEDRFFVLCQLEATHADGAALEIAIERRLSRALGVVLVRGAVDGFVELSRGASFDSADSVLLIVETAKASSLQGQFELACGAALREVSSDLPDRYTLLQGASCTEALVGAVLGERAPVRGLELVGGLLGDARSRTFLVGYPPTQIVHLGRPLGPDEEVLVGHGYCRVAEFLTALKRQQLGAKYTIQVGDAALSFSIASKKEPAAKDLPLAYALRDGRLDVVARPQTAEVAHLRGTYFHDRRGRSRRLASCDLARLVRRGKRLAISEADLRLLLGELQVPDESSALQQLAARQIAATRSVPLIAATSGLLQRLRTMSEALDKNAK